MKKVAKIAGYSIAVFIGSLSSLILLYTLINFVAASMAVASDPAQFSVKTSKPNVPELLMLVNQERAKYGVKPLLEDPRLDKSAQFKADDMNKRAYFSHEDPKTGKDNGLVNLLKETGEFCAVGSENLYWTERDALTSTKAIEWWIGSKGHHDAMIDSKYQYTGFGISGGNIVQHFCQPA